MAGDRGNIQYVVRHRARPPADRCHCPRRGHVQSPSIWQGFWWVERGARGGWSRSGLCPSGRSSLAGRHSRHAGTHRLPSRPGLEGLQSVEGPVGSLEDRGKGGRAEDHAGRKSGRARAIRKDLETIAERHGWRLSKFWDGYRSKAADGEPSIDARNADTDV